MQDEDKVKRDDSIWTTSDVNAYHKASKNGNMQLTLLSNGRLVLSTMKQSLDPNYAPQCLPFDKCIMGDCEPNVTIGDTVNTSNVVMLPPRDDGSFAIDHLSVE